MSAPNGAPQGCPQCGGPVTPVVAGHDSAPWLCSRCDRSWWHCELGVAGWRPDGCWPHAVHLSLRPLWEQERRDARLRGTSVRPDQLGLVDGSVLARLPKRGDVAWRKSVVAAGAAKGLVLSDGIPVAPVSPVTA